MIPEPVEPEAPIESPTGIDAFDAKADELWGRIFRGHPVADRVFYLASELGDFSLIWLLIAAASGVRSDEDADASIRFGLLLLAESALVNQGIKRVIRRPRPVPIDDHPHDVRLPRTSSFPSGHSSSALAAAGIIGAQHPKARPVLYGLAAVVATSRVHLKVHHVSDVIAGAAIGIVFAKVAARVWPMHRPR
jgi:membrane-associated phospholipid phosphatase